MDGVTVSLFYIFYIFIHSLGKLLNMGIPNGIDWICKGSVILGILNAYATFMTLGVIALNR